MCVCWCCAGATGDQGDTGQKGDKGDPGPSQACDPANIYVLTSDVALGSAGNGVPSPNKRDPPCTNYGASGDDTTCVVVQVRHGQPIQAETNTT